MVTCETDHVVKIRCKLFRERTSELALGTSGNLKTVSTSAGAAVVLSPKQDAFLQW